jgi:hypothetical protein
MDVLALEGERRISRDDEQRRELRQRGNDVFEMPSAKYSCSASPLILANGRTAIDCFSGNATGPGVLANLTSDSPVGFSGTGGPTRRE